MRQSDYIPREVMKRYFLSGGIFRFVQHNAYLTSSVFGLLELTSTSRVIHLYELTGAPYAKAVYYDGLRGTAIRDAMNRP